MEKTKTNMWKNVIKIIKVIWKVKSAFIFISILPMLINSFYPIISLILMQKILNILQKVGVDFRLILFYILLYIGVDLVQTIIATIMGYFINKESMLINLCVKEKVMKKVSNLSLKEFESSDTYNYIQRAQNESEGKVTSYFNSVLKTLSIILTIFSYLVMLLLFKPWLIIIVLIVPVIKYRITRKINKKQFKMITNRTNEERKTWYYTYLITNGNFNKEMKIYKLYEYFIEKFVLNKKLFMKQDISILKESNQKILFFSIIEQLLDGLIFGYIVYCGVVGEILLGDVVTYTRAVMQTKTNVQNVLQSFAELEKESLYLDQLFLLLEMRETSILVKDLNRIKIKEINSIKIKDLSYRYSQGSSYILKNINLEFKKGQSYAILGRNGSGKTTLAKLIMGFYDEYEGDIYINGDNLRLIDKESYRNCIGALFQDFGRYETTIRENIAYGDLSKINDDKSLSQAAKDFGIFKVIDENSKKLDAQLGYWFDNGTQISIGQWQKLALCRAFLKSADVYVLDEPNAALDAISEYKLAELYWHVLNHKLGIIIAHKFGHFIEHMDQVIVLDRGEVVEKGSHNDLLSQEGIYKELYSLQ